MGLQFDAALLSNIENSLKYFSTFQIFFLLKIIIFVYPQWSSSHERTKIIQEGLLNPSVDILEDMTETEAVCTGKTLVPINFNPIIPQLESFSFDTFSSKIFLFFRSCL